MLSYHKLNFYLGQKERFIEKKIEYHKKNSNYFFSYVELSAMKYSLNVRFRNNCESVIRLIDNYMEYHKFKIPFSHESRYQIYKYHPDFNENYFSSIDSLEKAYWLGFFFADGTISNDRRLRLYLSASVKYIKSNYNHLIRFCKAVGLNPAYIDFVHRLEKNKIIRYHHFIHIQFSSNEMAKDLFNLGFKGSRSKSTLWPKMRYHNKLIELSFLLGFYDGEADIGRSRIYSANKNLLNCIKHKFNIPYEVIPSNSAFSLSLSGQLVNLMQAIFPKSLELKRHTFKNRNTELIIKNLLSSELLSDLLKILSIKEIAQIFSVEEKRILRILEK